LLTLNLSITLFCCSSEKSQVNKDAIGMENLAGLEFTQTERDTFLSTLMVLKGRGRAHADGTPVHIAFILSCSGLQSMIIFVGAIAALRTVPLNRRLRGLFIAVPTILVLNTFRNAGIVWLSHSYSDWIFMGLNMFDFAHSYAAKAASLFAMFLMAIALFDLLPELHRHIMRFIPPSPWPKKQKSVSES
ncbi:MAG TPA: hypothetical protein EYO84_04990, partial [Planctomycetes bacterium]|nr:hypothetical protein [Planctomycetota bacterium]